MVRIDLDGRVAVVTGASSGIGAETAQVLAGCGARVVAVGRDEARLARTVGAIEAAGGEAIAVPADLAQVESAQAVIDAAVGLGGRVDILVLAAGQFHSAPLADTSVDDLDELYAVHLRAPFLLVKAAQPHFSKGASVLFYSSTVTQSGFAPYAAYTAVKGGVDAMARSLAIELAPDVRVNVVVPGFTGTPMVFDQYEAAPWLEEAIVQRTPVGFLGGPESAAHAAAFLVSDLSSYVHGTRVVVDGGWTAQGWQA
jgi:NAD(P)-dependent dehydrogenase (short-subunit alcohol dehydrogenase family)